MRSRRTCSPRPSWRTTSATTIQSSPPTTKRIPSVLSATTMPLPLLRLFRGRLNPRYRLKAQIPQALDGSSFMADPERPPDRQDFGVKELVQPIDEPFRPPAVPERRQVPDQGPLVQRAVARQPGVAKKRRLVLLLVLEVPPEDRFTDRSDLPGQIPVEESEHLVVAPNQGQGLGVLRLAREHRNRRGLHPEISDREK